MAALSRFLTPWVLVCTLLIPSFAIGQSAWPAIGIANLSSDHVRLNDKDGKPAGVVQRQQIVNLVAIKQRIESAAGLYADFFVVEGKQPNAFVTVRQGRNVLGVNLPMLTLLGDDSSAWAALFGHEFAHLTLSHHSETESRRTGLFVLGTIAGVLLGRAGVPAGGTIADVGTTVIDRTFSREQERDADRKGVEYMVNAGYHPTGAIRLQEKMLRASSLVTLPFLNTHPSGEERIENLRTIARTYPEMKEAAPELPRTADIAVTVESLPIKASTPSESLNRGLVAYRAGNYTEAVAAWLPLAENGHADAQNNLGVAYEKGQGVAQDYRQAAEWYGRAAEQGHLMAQNSLGVLHEKGLGVPADTSIAATWYRLAAERGHGTAQNNLGVLYAKGNGITKNPVEAYVWFGLAAARGNQNAQRNQSVIQRDMSPEQMDEAKTRLSSWKPKVAK